MSLKTGSAQFLNVGGGGEKLIENIFFLTTLSSQIYVFLKVLNGLVITVPACTELTLS